MRALGSMLVAGLAVSCTVDASFVDERVYPCTSDADCGDGYGCVDVNLPDPSGRRPRFCAPRRGSTLEECVASCDGRCTAEGLCLAGCDPGAQDCLPGSSCIRVGLIPDDRGHLGICYGIGRCTSDGNGCAEGQQCLSSLETGTSGSFEDTYCLPAAALGRDCPIGYQFIPTDDGAGACLPLCSPADPRCPPGLGCLTQALLTGGAVAYFSLCAPGIPGVPCQDDTNCLLGACTAGACTLSCEAADRLVGGVGGTGCAGLGMDAIAITLSCDPTNQMCAPHYDYGYACTSEAECRQGLQCEELPGSTTSFCTRDCLPADPRACSAPDSSRDPVCYSFGPRENRCVPTTAAAR